MMRLATPGFSDAAQFLDDATQDERQRLQQSDALWVLEVVHDELGTVWEECRIPDWDGFGAVPVTQDVLRSTYCILQSLPLEFPAPSIGAEPDGSLTLEWHRSPRRTLSVSVSPDSYLYYAALIGASREHGAMPHFDELPEAIYEFVRRVYAA